MPLISTTMLPQPLRLALAACLLVGCGESLYGDSLETFAPALPEPERPVLEIRWFAGYGAGSHAPCKVERATVVEAGSVWDLGFGVVDVPAGLQPSAWGDGGVWRFSLGQVLLVEGGGPERRTSELFPLDGVWGVGADQLILVAEGDVERLRVDLGIRRNSAGDGLVEGVQLVKLGSPTSADDWMSDLTVPEPGGSISPRGTLYVSHTTYVFGASLDMAAGAGVERTTFEDCAK